ncbi:hypothetical protein HPB49_006111 [Dermacentor silvarum]|uniref:Uncharacterized protein n=1 Tax=Dermacentor silvarum TaxID=543639 RepID=A0ACB8D3N6_DERSI|nr:hypothetical protein HPB49_006111 [Dermacentor silvarum]
MARVKAKPFAQSACRRGIKIKTDWVPVELRTFTVTLDRKTELACRRRQFLVVWVCATTVQKSQGAIFSDVVHEYDHRHPQKLVYVALSRCTDVNRLYLTNAKRDHIFYHARENLDRDLLEEFSA